MNFHLLTSRNIKPQKAQIKKKGDSEEMANV